jgi:hypothetical protein
MFTHFERGAETSKNTLPSCGDSKLQWLLAKAVELPSSIHRYSVRHRPRGGNVGYPINN